MKPYKHLLGYLERYTILKIGRLHIRLHRIKRSDITPFQHTHPFSYISIILRGGYTDRVRTKCYTHGIGSVIFRKSSTPHRIVDVEHGTTTLFITWLTKDRKWKFVEYGEVSGEWTLYETGIYKRVLYGKEKYCKFDGYWFKSSDTFEGALAETEPSIDQNTVGFKLLP